jgi:hypothetical protein
MRKLWLKPITLGCTVAEAALVRALAIHQRQDGSFDIAATGRDVDVHPSLLAVIMKRPAVELAVNRWNAHGRLPKACENTTYRPRTRGR